MKTDPNHIWLLHGFNPHTAWDTMTEVINKSNEAFSLKPDAIFSYMKYNPFHCIYSKTEK